MAKIKYYYDTETCRYERVKTSLSDKIFLGLAFSVLVIVASFLLNLAFSSTFSNESTLSLERENRQLKKHYGKFDNMMASVNQVLDKLQDKDDKLYRGYFGGKPLPKIVREGGTGGTDRLKGVPDVELIRMTAERMNSIKTRLYKQGKSLEEIVTLAEHSTEKNASRPSILPLPADKSHFVSGYGFRLHPIYRIPKMHTGCDFSAPSGTKIYATGDGKIISAKRHSGYGNQIQVDHGHGYVSTYSHLSAFDIKPGDKVKRGQVIGRVGTTGVSVAPHLHYEVYHNGERVNPIHYFFYDLSPGEYDAMLETADRKIPSMGN